MKNQGTSRILVIGAGGLGEVLAKRFNQDGSDVHVCDFDPERLAKFADSPIKSHLLDVTDEVQVDRAAEEWGSFNGVVHSVGINSRKPIFETELSEWNKILLTNLTSAFLVGRAFGSQMTKTGGGRLLFISSVASTIPHKNHGAYAASKSGLNQLVRVLAHELADKGVTANLLAPGYIETDLTRAHLNLPGVRENLIRQVPIGRLGTSEELTGIASLLLSDESRFITGQVICVDGGRTLV